MPWPPDELDTDHDDEEVSAGLHPGMHNEERAAINDVVAQIGTLVRKAGGAYWWVAAPTGVAATDTAAIQAALDAAAAAGGGVVILEAGVYLAAGLEIDSRTALIGPGTIKRPTGNLNHVIESKTWATTGTIAAGAKALTVASAADIEVGQAIGVLGARGGSGEQFTTLTAGIDDDDDTIPVAATTRLPTAGTTYLLVDNEIISYTGIAGSTLTGVQRGRFGTAAAAHLNGATISFAETLISVVTAVAGNVVTLADAAVIAVTAATVTVGVIDVYLGGGLKIDGNRAAESLAAVSLYGANFDTARFVVVDDVLVTECDTGGVGFREGTQDCRTTAVLRIHNCGETGVAGAAIQLFRGVHRCDIDGTITGDGYIGVYIDDRTNTASPWDDGCNDNVVRAKVKISEQGSNACFAIAGACTRNRLVDVVAEGGHFGITIQDSVQASVTLPCDGNEVDGATFIGTADDAIVCTGDDNVWRRVKFVNVGGDKVTDSGARNGPGGRLLMLPHVMILGAGTPALAISSNFPAWMLDQASSEQVLGEIVFPTDWQIAKVVALFSHASASPGDVALRFSRVDGRDSGDSMAAGGSSNTDLVQSLTADVALMIEVTVFAQLVLESGKYVFRVTRRGAEVSDTLGHDLAFHGFEFRQVA